MVTIAQSARNLPMGNLGLFLQRKPAATLLRYPTLINYKVHAGSFHDPPNSDMAYGICNCVRDHSWACVYTHGGWAHRQRVSTTILSWKKKVIFSCAPDGIRTSVLGISSLTLQELSHPATPCSLVHTWTKLQLFLFLKAFGCWFLSHAMSEFGWLQKQR